MSLEEAIAFAKDPEAVDVFEAVPGVNVTQAKCPGPELTPLKTVYCNQEGIFAPNLSIELCAALVRLNAPHPPVE